MAVLEHISQTLGQNLPRVTGKASLIRTSDIHDKRLALPSEMTRYACTGVVAPTTKGTPLTRRGSDDDYSRSCNESFHLDIQILDPA